MEGIQEEELVVEIGEMVYKIGVPVEKNMYLLYKIPVRFPLLVQTAGHVVILVILVNTVLILLPKTIYRIYIMI